MQDDYNNDSGFVKPDANEYRERRLKNKKNGKMNSNPSKKNKENRDFIHREENKENNALERKNNIVFVISVITFLIVLIIAKKYYADMQKQQMEKLSKNKWYVSKEEDIKKVGYIEVQFSNNGTFDMYRADTQVSCMSGKYSVGLGGYVKLKSDERGFNPPGAWKCKKNSYFKYEFKDSMLVLTYKNVVVSFNKQGKEEEGQMDVNAEILNKRYFVNEQAKMVVTFYMDNMFIYTVEDLNMVFGENGEVLGDICFSGEYRVDPATSTIKVNVIKDDYLITSNPMWEGMTEYKKYEFLYKLENDYSKIVLQYDNKAYEFKKLVISE